MGGGKGKKKRERKEKKRKNEVDGKESIRVNKRKWGNKIGCNFRDVYGIFC